MEARAATALVAVALVAAATACGGSEADKAGVSAKEPVTLTLAKHDVNWAFAAFVAATSRLSGGSIRIEVLPDWRGGEVGYERGTVADVRAAKVQIGVVGVRVWDTIGVTSFGALVAPFLIDNLRLQRRVLESPMAAEMLEGVEQAGVVGLAVLPGALRRPLGFSRPLVRPSDYTGATVGVTPGGVARATIRVLRARPKAYPPGAVSGLDGAELDLATVAQNASRRARADSCGERRALAAGGDDRHEPRGVRGANAGAAGDPPPRRSRGACAGAQPGRAR